MEKRTKYFVLAILILLTSVCLAQNTTIENIISNPRGFEGHKVTIKGLVYVYSYGAGTTAYYRIKGDYGATIRVNTAEPSPETNKKYIVIGIVNVEQLTNIPWITELNKNLDNSGAPADSIKTAELNKGANIEKEKSGLNYIIILIGSLITIIVVLIIVYIVMKSRQYNKNSIQIYTPPVFSQKNPPDYVASSVKLDTSEMVSQTSDEFKTIKIANTSPKTLKFIPGKLVIISGEDTGKSFKIAGYPTLDGSVVSIGRDEVKGDKSYSHIQLMQKTISRKQAEIIQKDEKLYVKNMSETNYTQIDGTELKPNEKSEINPGSILRLGELELKYEI